MIFNMFTSKVVRQAKDMCKQVHKLLSAQRDILSAPAVVALEKALAETHAAIKNRATENALRDQMNELESTANKWIKPYPHSGIRENVEVLLVALAVAMAIRTFFFQPFKIPTGSMQPTLYGVTSENLKSSKGGGPPPNVFTRILDACVYGKFYHYQIAEDDGEVMEIGPVETFAKFINRTTVTVRYKGHAKDTPIPFWFTPDDYFDRRAGISTKQHFRKGEPIVNFVEVAGDHVFVDRVTYNFRPPKRGEIIVFETKGTHIEHQDQFYIKRLVALGGEQVQIGNDRHLVIDGKRLDSSTPHFEKVYSFDPAEPLPTRMDPFSGDVRYLGHVNGNAMIGMEYFPNENTVYQVPPNHYMVMGDNTLNSSDSRYWGDFSRTNVIGKYFCVYWPVSKRIGWSVR